jgi:Zn-dependent M28 family amino/carboxypeptidase
MIYLVKQMKFSVPVEIHNQEWFNEESLILYGNLVVSVEGTEDKQKAIIIGAHYDVQNSLSSCWRGTTGRYLVTQGADDNTSGTVGCLTLLRRFTKKPPKFTTIVACFDGEEPGEWNGLAVGSDYFMKNISQLKIVPDIKYVSSVIVDMIGATPTTNGGLIVATSKHIDDRILQQKANENVKIETKITVLEPSSRLSCLTLSDSLHFPKYGIPTVLLSYLGGYQSVPKFYHTERDSMDIINWKTYFQTIDLFEYLCSEPLPVHSEIKVNLPTADEQFVNQLVEMGFSKEQAKFALIQTNNDVAKAIALLM